MTFPVRLLQRFHWLGLPGTLLLALLQRTPVVRVATAVGDVPQMVAAENAAYVVPPHAFEAALARLVDDKAAQRALGRANEKKAREAFDENVMAARYAELIG